MKITRLINWALSAILLLITNNLLAWQPDSLATYKGQYYFIQAGQKVNLDLELKIEKLNDSTWKWLMVYAGGEMKKDYQLIKKGADQFELDEQNGIRLMGYFVDGQLIFSYSVDSIWYTVSYEIGDKEIRYRIFYFDQFKFRESPGNEVIIRDYELSGTQYGRLVKVR